MQKSSCYLLAVVVFFNRCKKDLSGKITLSERFISHLEDFTRYSCLNINVSRSKMTKTKFMQKVLLMKYAGLKGNFNRGKKDLQNVQCVLVCCCFRKVTLLILITASKFRIFCLPHFIRRKLHRQTVESFGSNLVLKMTEEAILRRGYSPLGRSFQNIRSNMHVPV